MKGFSLKTIFLCQDENLRRLCKFMKIEGWDVLPVNQLISELRRQDIVYMPKPEGAWGSIESIANREYDR